MLKRPNACLNIKSEVILDSCLKFANQRSRKNDEAFLDFYPKHGGKAFTIDVAKYLFNTFRKLVARY